ncbi:hypothetical protein Ae201684_018297 [Aphanomyces euteiches]|uniref:TIR domain-containing protein n=1 Tax=Aphanomyces euteiches TaxID=100861 RepID=A0A6G0W5T8_9STRA|nr:hypothetical protein Ae201684_018297 [Aphanomyces euteiches]KAH9137323.1 hypothetical protein AeRB84_017873 [Aphanomyces euteiches]
MGAGAGTAAGFSKYKVVSRDLSRNASGMKPQIATMQHQIHEANERRKSVELHLSNNQLQQLGGSSDLVEPANQPRSQSAEYQVYLAYANSKDSLGRSVKDRVAAIHASLVTKEFVVWFDGEKSLASSKLIDHGVIRSSVVVIFLTRNYMNQVNSDGLLDSSQHEFCLALATQGLSHIVLCVMEDDMKLYDNLTGEWRVIVGDCECLDFTDEELLDLACDELATRIRGLLDSPNERLLHPCPDVLDNIKDLVHLLKDTLTPRPTCVKIMKELVALAMLAPYADKMVDKGILPLLVRALHVDKVTAEKTDLALLLLKIFARTSCIYRRKIITLLESRQLMPLCVQLLVEGESAAKEHTAGLIRNLFSGGSIKAFEKSEYFQVLVKELLHMFVDGTSIQQYEAGAALSAIAFNKEYQPSIVNANGIRICLAKLTSETTIEGVRDKAAIVLRCLSATEANQKEIGMEGGVEAFMTLLQNGTAAQRETASAALNWLMEVQENRSILVKERGIRTLLNYFVRQQAISALSKLAPHSEFQVPLAQAGVLGPCVAIMETGNDSQKTAACSILLAVASTEAMATMHEAIPSIIKMYNGGTLSQKNAAKQVLERLCRNKTFRGKILNLVGNGRHVLRLIFLLTSA